MARESTAVRPRNEAHLAWVRYRALRRFWRLRIRQFLDRRGRRRH